MKIGASTPAVYRKRCKRHNAPGEYHYLTFSCFQRQPFLVGDRARRWLAEAIIQAQENHPFRLIAYVFMPEHVHLMILPTGQSAGISEILKAIKLPVAIRARTFVTKHHPEFLHRMEDLQPNGKRAIRFWQRGGGYDRNIFTANELWEKIAYIHQNPVRRKLVPRANEWTWSSAGDYAGVRTGPLPVDRTDLPWR